MSPSEGDDVLGLRVEGVGLTFSKEGLVRFREVLRGGYR